MEHINRISRNTSQKINNIVSTTHQEAEETMLDSQRDF
jgi:hypothetical protein